MNDARFDRLGRSLSRHRPRRQCLGLLAGGLAPLFPLAGSRGAAKKRRKKKGKQHGQHCSPACTGARVCKHGACVCPGGTEECGGECRNACGGNRARNPHTCDCCIVGGGSYCHFHDACCSNDCIIGLMICASRGPGDTCTFDAQCSSGDCNGFCGS